MSRLFSLEELIHCVEREIVLRKRVYPALILKRRMPEAKAAYEIECMEAVLSELKTRQPPELL